MTAMFMLLLTSSSWMGTKEFLRWAVKFRNDSGDSSPLLSGSWDVLIFFLRSGKDSVRQVRFRRGGGLDEVTLEAGLLGGDGESSLTLDEGLNDARLGIRTLGLGSIFGRTTVVLNRGVRATHSPMLSSHRKDGISQSDEFVVSLSAS
jgi:hypothetical protein